MAAFEEVGICPELITACEELGWSLPTDIQAEVVPLILGGGDVMAAAETGSGKTGAFSLPVVQIVHERMRRGPGEDELVAEQEGGTDGSVRMSLHDRSTIMAVSDDGMQCQARSDREWGGVRGTKGVPLVGGGMSGRPGKVFYEVLVEDDGLCRVGWTTKHGSLELGTDKESYGYGGTGKKSHAKKFEEYGETFGLHDVIGCWLDVGARKLGFTKNGVDLGVAYEVGKNIRMLYPAVTLKNAQVQLNFEETRFAAVFKGSAVSLAEVAQVERVEQKDRKDRKGTKGQEVPERVPGSGRAPTPVQRLPVAIVLEPVRDLAQQTKDVMETFAAKLSNPSVHVSLLVGGESSNQQMKEIAAGAAIVVGTPGRVNDLIKQDKLDVSGVKFVVLDEADALLDAGHRDLILNIFRRLGTTGKGVDRLQTLLFSATLHAPHVTRLANELCQNAAFIDMKGMNALPDAVDHALVMVNPEEDRTWLQSTPPVFTDRIHDLEPPLDPTSSGDESWSHAVKVLKPRLLQRVLQGLAIDQALIFCRTNFDCENLQQFFHELDKTSADVNSSPEKRKRSTAYSCAILAGAKSMDERRYALEAFKAKDVRFLIATDVAARGIDVSGLPFVINMTLPDKCEDYVHRSGRVGRAETPGLCISLVSTVSEKVWFCRKKGLKPWLNPTRESVLDKKPGHATWIQEKILLRDIEERLGTAITPLQSDMSLPPALVESRSKYGKGKGAGDVDDVPTEVVARIEASRHSAKQLSLLEHRAQQTFFSLKSMFAGGEPV